MADESTEVIEQTTTTETETVETTQAEPQGAAGTDWKAEARKWENRAKKNSAAAEANAAATKELTEAREQLAQAQAEANALKAEKARRETIARVANEQGVDAEMLSWMAGDTDEDIAKNADLLKAKMTDLHLYPNVADQGGASAAAAAPTAESILAIKNPQERRRAIAAHPDLFK